MKHFSTRFNVTSMKFKTAFNNDPMRFNTDFHTIIKVVVDADNLEHYEGDYEITPSAESQEMLTKNKLMDKDVTIRAIPYKETPNSGGRGTTVRIG